MFELSCTCCVLKVCETLDRRQGLESSELWLAVPVAAADMPDPSAQQQAEEQDVETSSGALEASWEDWPVQAKLAHVLNHLRQSYCYCLYCGCQVSLWICIRQYVWVCRMLTALAQAACASPAGLQKALKTNLPLSLPKLATVNCLLRILT